MGAMPASAMLLRACLASTCFSLFFALSLQVGSVRAEDWPQFRGPDGQGHSSETGLPLRWSETENIVWKVPIPGRGWSSPTVLGDKIWLTTASDGGRSLRVICLDRQSGGILHDVEVFRVDNPLPIHSKNSHASPTPIAEKNRVYVHFGTSGTAGLSDTGEILWKTQLPYQHGHGPAGSPVLYGDSLIVSCDGTDVQYVVALDKANGRIRWKRFRNGRMAFSTPLLIRSGEVDQLVSPGGDRVVAYNPLTGDEIWWLRYDGYSNVPRPVFGQGVVFICSGFYPPVSLYAIRPDGRGDVTDTHVAWSSQRGMPLNPSPLLVGDKLYTVSDSGIATCLDATTGRTHWRKRLRGDFSASPLYADGRIYFLDEEGTTTVIAPSAEFQELATNSLNGRTLASMAVSAKSIYVRTEHHLYRLQKTDRESNR